MLHVVKPAARAEHVRTHAAPARGTHTRHPRAAPARGTRAPRAQPRASRTHRHERKHHVDEHRHGQRRHEEAQRAHAGLELRALRDDRQQHDNEREELGLVRQARHEAPHVAARQGRGRQQQGLAQRGDEHAQQRDGQHDEHGPLRYDGRARRPLLQPVGRRRRRRATGAAGGDRGHCALETRR
jgi:hypothetical protein